MAQHSLNVRYRPELLFAMMETLAGDATSISFEGQLAKSELFAVAGATFDETPVLRRGTLWPKEDFVVFPLTFATLPLLRAAIESKISFTGGEGIIHVQIEKQG